MSNIKYSEDEIKLWAAEYKKLLSFSRVAEIFKVSKDTIRYFLYKYKEFFNIEFKREIDKKLFEKGLKICPSCNETKTANEFREYSAKCFECYSKYQKEYRDEHKEEAKEYNKNYRREHLEECRKQEREYNRTHRKNANQYFKNRREVDPNFKISGNLRTRLNKALQNSQKIGSAIDDLGCTIDKLKIHLEQQFYSHSLTDEEMTWENYGKYGWHIDHIIPLASFDLTDREQFLKACHYTNLQPLWAEDNYEKGAKI